MTKTTFLLGAGIGFILGSRTGRGPYQQLETKVREFARRPEVQDKAGRLKDAAKEQASAIADQVTLSGSTAAESHVTPPDPTPTAQKEAMVDDLLEQGVPPAEMEQQEEELRQSGELSEPPAGNKAKPANGR